MKHLYRLVLLLVLAAAVRAQEPGQALNMTLFDKMNPVDTAGLHAALWGYTAPDGREYALFGSQIGTHIIDITEKPIRQVAYIAGPRNQWREMKVYKNYAYVVSEANNEGGGLQIIDLTNLPASAQLVRTDTSNFKSAHTVYIRDHYLYAMGTGAVAGANGGAIILDLEPDPLHPRRIGMVNPYYYHDAWVRNDTLLGAAIYGQGCDIYDIRDKANPRHLATITYPGSGTHNAEITSDGGYVITSDEIGATQKTMKVWDIRDLNNITKVAEFTPDVETIVHNVHVKGRYVVAAWYTSGVRIIDMIDPRNPRQVGFYDTHPEPGGGFNGVWEAFPYFPSGKIIISDRNTGLHVLEFNGATAGSFSGVVRDISTGNPLANVKIAVPELGETVTTDASGRYYVGGANGQQVTLRTGEFRYAGTSESLTFAGDQQKDILLSPLQFFSATINARDESGNAIENFSYAVEPHFSSAVAGATAVVSLPRDSTYTLTVGKWGYKVEQLPITISQDGSPVTVTLRSGYSDNATLDLGWLYRTSGDTVSTGAWLRMAPYHVYSGSGWFYPETEPSGVPGGYVFQTGAPPLQGLPQSGDVNGGYTTLTSPAMNLSGMSEAIISFDYWFVHYIGRDTLVDSLNIQLSNDDGVTWTTAYWQLDGLAGWNRKSIRVADHLAPTDRVRIRFRVSDLLSTSLVYAAMDNFTVDAGVPSSVPADDAASDGVAVLPNPFRGSGSVALRLQEPSSYLRVEIFNSLGERRGLLHEGAISSGEHRFAIGGDLPSGSYALRLTDEHGAVRSTRFQVIR